MTDRPNPKANIGFLCSTPFDYYACQNIYMHLSNAEFIVESDSTVSSEGGEIANLRRAAQFISHKRVFWRYNDPATSKRTGKEFYSKYAVLVSTRYHPILAEPYNHDKKLVRVLGSNAKESWNFGVWHAYFDLVLSHGDHSHRLLSLYGNSLPIGDPKFDNWFNGESDKKAVHRLRQKLDRSKETILYVPTHGNLSSLPILSDALHHLSLHYNVILKAHHLTQLTEEHLLKPYRDNPHILLTDDADDLLTLLKPTNVVISDNSGAVFDAILADKPVVLIDFLEKIFFPIHKEGPHFPSYGPIDNLGTTPNSLEQRVKRPREEIGPVVRVKNNSVQLNADQLEAAILLALEDTVIHKARRQATRALVYAYRDGKSGLRAARAITKLLHQRKPSRNPVAAALDHYMRVAPTGQRRPEAEDANGRSAYEAGQRYHDIKLLPPLERIQAILEDFF